MNNIILLSEFGRGRDKKKRIKRQFNILKNKIKQEPGKSTQIAGSLGMIAGGIGGAVLTHKIIGKGIKSGIIKNNALGILGMGAVAHTIIPTTAATGVIGGMLYNNKIRKKSLYE